jgi:hypothetical protein
MSDTSQQAARVAEAMAHSQGPWLLKRDVNREQYSIRLQPSEPGAVGYREVCTIQFGYTEPAESEQHANARLIAAAPDLLAAAKRLRRVINDHVSLADVDALDAAIAKAEGRS